VALYEALIAAGGEIVFQSRAVAADPRGWLLFADGSKTCADLVIAADGINSPIRDSLGLLRWRRPVNQFGYRAMIRREPGELASDIGRTHCENWNGSRRLLYAPCTEQLAYVQLTSLKDDEAANQVPIDRAVWRSAFPHLGWIIDRLPDDGRGDWFELIRTRNWVAGRVALVGDAASGQPPFLGQGGGCAMMAGYTLAEAIDHAGDVTAGIARWQHREQPVTEWIQQVAYWYGQLALLSPATRTLMFRVLDRSRWLRDATLFFAAGRDPTVPEYWLEGSAVDYAFACPLVH
jgi:2-polyprenyl-6-methoxyphenol hydroxylase-like FAD-dependent oxidoreductase